MELFDFQVGHVDQLTRSLLRYGAALDASDLGTGKTPCALFVAKKIGLRFGVVCLKSGITNWRRTAAEIGLEPDFVVNYEKLKHGGTGLGKRVGTEFIWTLDRPTLIIWDEGHVCKAPKSINAYMLIGAKKHGHVNLVLSATIANSPLEMRALGYVLGLHKLTDYWQWAVGFGLKRNRWNGFIYTGGDGGLKKINEMIFPEKGSRMRVDELGDRILPTLISAECYDMEAEGDIKKVYAEMQAELAELSMKESEDKPNPMTIMLRGLQRAELFKVPVLAELAENAVQEDQSVVIFTNFRQSMAALGDRLGTNCMIHGDLNDAERAEAIDDFTADRERIILVQIKAGGTGTNLNDIHGKHRRLALVSPNFSMVTLKQALGRVARVNNKTPSTQRIIFAANTPEERACKAVKAKLHNLSLLTDGDLQAGLFEMPKAD